MNDLAADWNQVRATFKKIWGYEDFRPPQGEIIQTLLNAKDALIVMPTGGGKSICFQLPALLKSGLTLVISPLVALMENQVQELQQLNLSAALLHNEIPRSQRKKPYKHSKNNSLNYSTFLQKPYLVPPSGKDYLIPKLKLMELS